MLAHRGRESCGSQASSIPFSEDGKCPIILPMADEPRDYFQEGIDLFNAGRYFECHEAWEYVWNRSEGDEKIAIQGLIQAAVAILHLERGNHQGAESLYAKARAKLDPLADNFRQVAIAELRESLAGFFSSARATEVDSVRVRPQIRRIRPGA
jgi:uncharacterized protein